MLPELVKSKLARWASLPKGRDIFNVLIVLAVTTVLGKLFQTSIVLLVKLYFLRS